MDKKWAKNHGYGCWDHHRSMSNVSHVSGEIIAASKIFLEEKGFAVSSFGLPESMGYLIPGFCGLVLERRIFSDNDFYPELDIFSDGDRGVEKIAFYIGLPEPWDN